MLPNSVVTVDSQLNTLKTFRRIGLGNPLSDGGTQRHECDYDRVFSNSIQVIDELLRGSGDIASDSRLKLLSQPGEQIERIDLLLAEVGPREDFRRLVLVEDKLSTNNECRRDVLAQILEYAHTVQTKLTADRLSRLHLEWVEDYRDELDRGMRSGGQEIRGRGRR